VVLVALALGAESISAHRARSGDVFPYAVASVRYGDGLGMHLGPIGKKR
jgi:hypothetical protein